MALRRCLPAPANLPVSRPLASTPAWPEDAGDGSRPSARTAVSPGTVYVKANGRRCFVLVLLRRWLAATEQNTCSLQNPGLPPNPSMYTRIVQPGARPAGHERTSEEATSRAAECGVMCLLAAAEQPGACLFAIPIRPAATPMHPRGLPPWSSAAPPVRAVSTAGAARAACSSAPPDASHRCRSTASARWGGADCNRFAHASSSRRVATVHALTLTIEPAQGKANFVSLGVHLVRCSDNSQHTRDTCLALTAAQQRVWT